MRNWLNAARSYMRPIDIGEPMRAAGIGRVIASKSKKVAVGDLVRPSVRARSSSFHGDGTGSRCEEQPADARDCRCMGR